MPAKVKVFTVLLLWLTMGLTIAFGVQNTAVRIVLICIAIGVTAHIVLIGRRQAENIRK